MYEVNKVGVTDKQIKTEMIGFATGAGYGLLSEFTLGKYSKFYGAPRIFFNVVGSSIASDKMKKIYSDGSNEKEGRNNEEYYFNFTIFLWGCYFIFYCIVVCSNGCWDKKYPL